MRLCGAARCSTSLATCFMDDSICLAMATISGAPSSWMLTVSIKVCLQTDRQQAVIWWSGKAAQRELGTRTAALETPWVWYCSCGVGSASAAASTTCQSLGPLIQQLQDAISSVGGQQHLVLAGFGGLGRDCARACLGRCRRADQAACGGSLSSPHCKFDC